MTLCYLHDVLEQSAAKHPDIPALCSMDLTLSYAQLWAKVQTCAIELSARFQVGDRVAVLAWNSPEYLALIYAASKARLVLVPLNTRLARAEWDYQLTSTGASALFVDEIFAEQFKNEGSHGFLPLVRLSQFCLVPSDILGADSAVARPTSTHNWECSEARHEPCESVDTDVPVWILHTSGSTGKPKGAILTHRSFLAGLESAEKGRPVQQGDGYLYPFPLFHVSAHNVFLQHKHGACVYLLRSFDADTVLDLCRSGKITSMSLAPTMLSMLVARPDFDYTVFDSVRAIGYGAAAMPLDLMRALLENTQLELSQSYGMTELSGSVAFLLSEDHRAGLTNAGLMRSVGRPVKGVDLSIRDEGGEILPILHAGEVCIRADQMMRGYWNNESETLKAVGMGYLRTGDIGFLDERGYLTLVDRKKDMIISGGENVASREVEDVLRCHEGVDQCAVVGSPHERWGEIVCAFVVLKLPVEATALDEHCRRVLAGFKCPKRYFRLTELPVNAAGKIDKPALRLMIEEGAELCS
ncbi:MAG: AMP-binding protein [Halieaceae bacterium]|nr:AMP-binding protein [Halieaceae bacterium]